MDELIKLHNHQVQFRIDNNVYLIPRKDIESKFNLYWFMADLYRQIIKSVLKEKEWLDKYKIG